MSRPRTPPSFTPTRRPAGRRGSSTVESIDVATRLYTCRDCGTALRMGVAEPLPAGWVVLQGAVWGMWMYVCAACAGRRARR